MEFILGMILGSGCGALIMCLVTGAAKTKKESEIYMEGFIAGQKNAMKGGE